MKALFTEKLPKGKIQVYSFFIEKKKNIFKSKLLNFTYLSIPDDT